jgi:hypothetical protein
MNTVLRVIKLVICGKPREVVLRRVPASVTIKVVNEAHQPGRVRAAVDLATGREDGWAGPLRK